jgi:serine/threonine protein kinase
MFFCCFFVVFCFCKLSVRANNLCFFFLQPANVLVDLNTGRAKLADFGLTKAYSGPNAVVSSVAGTIRYLAPELFTSSKPASPATDAYALGVCLWELATLQVPFAGVPSDLNVVPLIMDGHRPDWPPSSLFGVAGLSPPLLAAYKVVVEQCWLAEPRRRPKVDDVVRCLAQLHTLVSLAEKEQQQSPQRREGVPLAPADDPENWTVAAFLASVRCAHLQLKFDDEGIDDFNVLCSLSNDELREIGVVLLGDRKRVLAGIEATKERGGNKPSKLFDGGSSSSSSSSSLLTASASPAKDASEQLEQALSFAKSRKDIAALVADASSTTQQQPSDAKVEPSLHEIIAQTVTIRRRAISSSIRSIDNSAEYADLIGFFAARKNEQEAAAKRLAVATRAGAKASNAFALDAAHQSLMTIFASKFDNTDDK